MGPDDALTSNEDGTNIEISFRPESTWWAGRRSAEDISRMVNNQVHRIYVKANTDVSEDLAACIRSGDPNDTRASEYRELGAKLQRLIVQRVNRFIGYLRTIKGQFWVEELVEDHENPGQFFIKSESQATIDGAPVDFDPDIEGIRLAAILSDDALSMHSDEWQGAIAFINGQSRFPIVGMLLANSRKHASEGNRRNALIDAVTALEVSLSDFAKHSKLEILGDRGARIEAETVGKLINKVGLRGALELCYH